MEANMSKWVRIPYNKARSLYGCLSASQAFNPKPWGVLVNPFFTTRRLLYREIKFLAKMMQGGTLLDIGCGSTPYRALFDVESYLGLDIIKFDGCINVNCDVSYDGQKLPFRDSSVDCALMSEVLEHVFEPHHLLSEIYRVLKPNGTLLATVPFVWDEHDQPYDFGRYTSFGLKYLLEKNSFDICYFKKNGSYINTLTQMVSSYIYTLFNRFSFPLPALAHIFLCAPILLCGEILSKVLPENGNLYLDNVLMARKQ